MHPRCNDDINATLESVLHSPELIGRLLGEGASAVLKGRDLKPDEHAALIALDFAALVRLGAHPVLAFGWFALNDPQARASMAVDPLHLAMLRGER